MTPPSRPNRRHQAFNADDGPSQIIGKRRQAELGANFFEALGEKGALIHPFYWLRVFGFSGLEELIGKVDSGERGVTMAILK